MERIGGSCFARLAVEQSKEPGSFFPRRCAFGNVVYGFVVFGRLVVAVVQRSVELLRFGLVLLRFREYVKPKRLLQDVFGLFPMVLVIGLQVSINFDG